MIGCIKEVISRMFSSSRSPRIVGATAEDFEAMASSHSSSEEIAKQKKIIAHLESIRPKIALKFQLAQAEDQLKIARQKLFELTGDPKDAIVSPVT
jgi:hypothetical protein